MVGVLHTWDRSLGYHLHVHYLIPASGWDHTTEEWKAAHPKFLVPCSAWRELFRATFRDALKAEALICFREALKLRPEFGHGYYPTGATLEGTGRRDGAWHYYHQAIRNGPAFARML